MPLAPVTLDDLTWTEMVESVRRRIPGASDGAWTLHAAVDPGMTLLELFAWLIEQRLFWIDQVSDEMTRALFAVVGERPHGARPAATVLACDAPAAAPFLELPAGVPFVFANVDAERTFTTQTAMVLAPVMRMAVETAEGDRTSELRAGRPIDLLANDGRASEFTIVLWMPETTALPQTAGKMSLLLHLETSERVEAQWRPGAPESVPAPAELAWSYSTGPSAFHPFNDGSVDDGSGGLRRSGLVRLPIPADWTPRGPAVGGQVPYAIRVRTGRATYTVRPRLVGVWANAAIAQHWKHVVADSVQLREQAIHWLKLPHQALQLSPGEPLPIADSVRLELRERDGAAPWLPVDDFAFADRVARVFVVDRDARTLRFGNGVTGRIPVPHDRHAPDLTVHYRAGGGVSGTLARGKTWVAAYGGIAIEARNPVDAVGGADPESLQAAATRIAGTLKRQERAVTRRDYEELALSTPGVAIARAHAVVGLHPLHPCVKTPGAVTVFVVPFAPRPDAFGWTWPDTSLVAAPVLDPGARTAVQRRLDAARLLTAQVFVRGTTYRPVSLEIDIAASPADAGPFESLLGARLSRYLDPIEGGDAGAGLPFGEPVRPSALLRVAQQALLERVVVEQVRVGLDDQPAAEACRDLAIGPYELPYLRSLRLVFRPGTRTGGLP